MNRNKWLWLINVEHGGVVDAYRIVAASMSDAILKAQEACGAEHGNAGKAIEAKRDIPVNA